MSVFSRLTRAVAMAFGSAGEECSVSKTRHKNLYRVWSSCLELDHRVQMKALLHCSDVELDCMDNDHG